MRSSMPGNNRHLVGGVMTPPYSWVTNAAPVGVGTRPAHGFAQQAQNSFPRGEAVERSETEEECGRQGADLGKEKTFAGFAVQAVRKSEILC